MHEFIRNFIAMLCTVAKRCKGRNGEIVVKVHGRPCFITLRNVVLPDSDWSSVSVGSTFEMENFTGWNMLTSSFDECRFIRSTEAGDFAFEALGFDTVTKPRPKWQTMAE